MSAAMVALLLAALGVLPTAVTLTNAAVRLYVRYRSGRNGAALAVAKHIVGQEAIRMMVHLSCLFGILILFCPYLVPRPVESAAAMDARTATFAVITVLLAVKSLLALRHLWKIERLHD